MKRKKQDKENKRKKEEKKNGGRRSSIHMQQQDGRRKKKLKSLKINNKKRKQQQNFNICNSKTLTAKKNGKCFPKEHCEYQESLQLLQIPRASHPEGGAPEAGKARG